MTYQFGWHLSLYFFYFSLNIPRAYCNLMFRRKKPEKFQGQQIKYSRPKTLTSKEVRDQILCCTQENLNLLHYWIQKCHEWTFCSHFITLDHKQSQEVTPLNFIKTPAVQRNHIQSQSITQCHTSPPVDLEVSLGITKGHIKSPLILAYLHQHHMKSLLVT